MSPLRYGCRNVNATTFPKGRGGQSGSASGLDSPQLDSFLMWICLF